MVLTDDLDSKEFMLGYLQCVKRNRGDGRECEDVAKKYLTCRMDK